MHYRSSSRNTWEVLDEFLESWKLCRKHVAKDASCLFRAVAEQVMSSQSHHLELRDLCATYIRLHPDQVQPLLSRPVEEHVQRLLDPAVFGGPAELYAIAHIFKAEVVVYQETPGNGFAGHVVASCSPLKTPVEKIQLATSHAFHYDIVYSRRQEATRAYCQSLTYNMLYSSVLGMQDVQSAAVSMLHDNNGSMGPYSDRRDSSASNGPPGCIGSLMEKLGLGDEEDKDQDRPQGEVEHETGTVNTGDNDSSHKSNGECPPASSSSPSGPVSAVDVLGAGDLPFPFRVAKCLDRNIYRNTEYDTWADLEPRHGSCDGRGLQAGVKVLVQLTAVPFKARLLGLRDQHLLRTRGGATPPSSSTQDADATTTPNSSDAAAEAITAKEDVAANDALPVRERNKLNKQDDVNKPAKGEEGGEVFHGIIQEMAENKGPVNVYIEEIASRIDVPYDALEPVSPSPTRSPYHKGGGGGGSPSHYPSQGYKGGPGFFNKPSGPVADYGPGRRKGRLNSISGRTAGPPLAPPIAANNGPPAVGRGGRGGPRHPQNKYYGRGGNGGGPGPGDGFHRTGGGPGGGDGYHRNPDENADNDVMVDCEAAAEDQEAIAPVPPPADPPAEAVDVEGDTAVRGTGDDKDDTDNSLVQLPAPPLAAQAPRGNNNSSSSSNNNSSKEYHQPVVPHYQAGGGALMPGGPMGYPYPGGPPLPYPPRHQFPSPPYGYGPPGRQHYGGMQGPRGGPAYTVLPHGGGGRYTSPHRGSSGHTPANRGRGQGNNYHGGSKNGNNNHGGYSNSLPPNHGQHYNNRNGDSRNIYGNNIASYGNNNNNNNNGGNSSRGNNSTGRNSNGGGGYNRYGGSATAHYCAGDRVPSASGHNSRSMYSSNSSLSGGGNSNTQQRALLPPRLQQRSYYNSNNSNNNSSGSNSDHYSLENNKNSRKPGGNSNNSSASVTSGNKSDNTGTKNGKEPAPGISSPPPSVHVPVDTVPTDAPAPATPVTVACTSVTTPPITTSTTTGVSMAASYSSTSSAARVAVTSGNSHQQNTVTSHSNNTGSHNTSSCSHNGSSAPHSSSSSGHHYSSSGHHNSISGLHGPGPTSSSTTPLIYSNPSVYPARPHSASTLHGKGGVSYGGAAYPPQAFAHPMSSYLSSLSGYVRSQYEGQPLLNMGSLRRPPAAADPYPVAPPQPAPLQAVPMMATYQGEDGMTTMVQVYHVPGTSGGMVPSMACYPQYQGAGEASCPAGMMMPAPLPPPLAQHYYTPAPPSAGPAAPLIYPGHHHGTPGQWVVSPPGHLMPHTTVSAAAYPQPYPSPMMGTAPIPGYSYPIPRPPPTYMPH